MTTFGPSHPLDVELADLVSGTLDQARAAELEEHLSHCLLCRVKRRRFAEAGGSPGTPLRLPNGVGFDLPGVVRESFEPAGTRAPAPGELWLAGEDDRLLLLVMAVNGDRALVAPAVLGGGGADDETVVLLASDTPLGMPLTLYPVLAAEIPTELLRSHVTTAAVADSLAGLLDATSHRSVRGEPIADASDPRLELRQYLVDRLAALDEVIPDPLTTEDAPRPRRSDIAGRLAAQVRARRGHACEVLPLADWGPVRVAGVHGWLPLFTVEEVGVLLVAFDTPAGLNTDEDFHVARAVLTRLNATGLVVTAVETTDLAELFDASALNYGIEMPSGELHPPRPLLDGLSAVDAITKHLDQTSGAAPQSWPSRGQLGVVDVVHALSRAAEHALADIDRQSRRYRIDAKAKGYREAAREAEALQRILLEALDGHDVVEPILDLSRRP